MKFELLLRIIHHTSVGLRYIKNHINYFWELIMRSISFFVLFLFAVNFASAEEIKEIEVEIDYKLDKAENFEFFGKILELDGQAVDLKLTLKPEGEASDHISFDIEESEEEKKLGCLGVNAYPEDLNDFRSGASVTFRAREEYHHNAKIIIGDRQQYPFQTLRCLGKGYSDQSGLVTYISGRFVPSVAYFPTGVLITLFPLKKIVQ